MNNIPLILDASVVWEISNPILYYATTGQARLVHMPEDVKTTLNEWHRSFSSNSFEEGGYKQAQDLAYQFGRKLLDQFSEAPSIMISLSKGCGSVFVSRQP